MIRIILPIALLLAASGAAHADPVSLAVVGAVLSGAGGFGTVAGTIGTIVAVGVAAAASLLLPPPDDENEDDQ